MLFTTHAVTGAAIGVATKNPYAALTLGAISHHVLDAIPHFDQGTFYLTGTRARYLNMSGEYVSYHSFARRDWVMLFADWTVAAVIFIGIFASIPVWEWGNVMAGTIGALLPDIIDSSPLWSEKLRKKSSAVRQYNIFHGFFHWTVSRPEIWLGVCTQLVLIGISLAYLLR